MRKEDKMKKGWKKQSLGGKRGKSEKIQDYRSERNESKDSHMYPPREVSGPLALVDLPLWAFQVWLPVFRRGLRKALFGSLSFSLGGFCLYVHGASGLSHLFTF